MKTERGLVLLFALMLMVSCSNEKKTGASSVEETETVEDTIIQDGQSQEENAAPGASYPARAVVLRDEASVWDSEDEETTISKASGSTRYGNRLGLPGN